jgi:hypothetical protein
VLSVDAIVENQQGEDGTIELSTNFRNDVFKNVHITGSALPWQQVTLLDVSEIPNLQAFSFYPFDWRVPAAMMGLRITCLSGNVKLAGLVFHTFKGIDIPFESMTFSQNWNSELGGLDGTPVRYADTNNSTVTIPFNGNGVEVMLQGGTTGGILSASVDGTAVNSTLDLYASVGGAALLYSLKVFPNNLDYSKPIGGNYGSHSIQLTLIGANPSASAPSLGRRTFSICGAQAIDSR